MIDFIDNIIAPLESRGRVQALSPTEYGAMWFADQFKNRLDKYEKAGKTTVENDISKALDKIPNYSVK